MYYFLHYTAAVGFCCILINICIGFMPCNGLFGMKVMEVGKLNCGKLFTENEKQKYMSIIFLRIAEA